ncbi:hypothetical protein CFP56_026295 [Quercus suber]|uniref:No apical meristem-associated C-terminal domain-containing protein n=1 Tax=Quercus suber TaxID=58331 RepID=A0AAW0JZZ2_QUESU
MKLRRCWRIQLSRVDEDLLLISAWLNIGMDAMHGIEQNGDKFWTKIWESFCANNTYGITRSSTSLSSRWGNINRETSRFTGFMAKVEAQNKSGITDEDKASHEQDQEALCIKAEKLRLKTIKEEGRIMTMDTSGMNDKEIIYFENLKDRILARQIVWNSC